VPANFEWDELKRLANLEKHGFDFMDADRRFEGPHYVAETRTVGTETRWLATGMIGKQPATAVFTRRGANIRLISLRSARDGEKARYQALFA
jgi:uncharacterized DUF497 family protein